MEKYSIRQSQGTGQFCCEARTFFPKAHFLSVFMCMYGKRKKKSDAVTLTGWVCFALPITAKKKEGGGLNPKFNNF